MKKSPHKLNRYGPANSPENQLPKKGGATKNPLITRGRMLVGAAVMATLAAISVNTRDEAPQPTNSPLSPSPSSSLVTMPQFEIHDGLEVSPFIKNSKIPPEQLQEISQKMLTLIKEGITNFVIPELRMHPDQKRQVLSSFLDQVVGHMKGIHPEIAADMVEITKGREADAAYRVIRYINAYLLDQNYLLDLGSNDAGYTINMYPVVKKKTVTVRDSRGEEKVPAIYVGNGISDDDKEGQYGFMPPPFADYIVVHTSTIKGKGVDGILEYYSRNNLTPPSSRERLAEDMENDVARHEATHAFLAHRFPHADKKMSLKGMATLHKEIPIPGTSATMPLRGEFPAMTLSELAAWGAQIGASESQIPYGHIANFSESGDPIYVLLNRLLPLATLQFAPESRLKSRITQGLLRGSVEFDDFRKLVTQPGFPHRDIQRSGMYIYQQAYSMIEELDNKARQ